MPDDDESADVNNRCEEGLQPTGRLISRFLNRLDPGAAKHPSDFNPYDESVLQQGRFWMRTVTWSLIGTTVFGVAWLALARTEEIVVASGQLEPVDSFKTSRCPWVVLRIRFSLRKAMP